MNRIKLLRMVSGATLAGIMQTGCFISPVPTEGGINSRSKTVTDEGVNPTDTREVQSYDPNATEAQVLTANSVASLDGTTVTLSPGALSVPTNIVLEEGQSLKDTAIMQELGLGGSATVTQSAAAVIVRPESDAALQKPMTLEIPMPSVGLWSRFFLADAYDNAVILYRVFKGDQGLVSGLMTRSQFTVANGVAQFETSSFGSFQVVILEQKVEQPVEAKSEEPIRNVSNVPVVTATGVVPPEEIVAKEEIPAVTWNGSTGVFQTASRSVQLSASFSGDFTLKNCRAMLRQNKDVPEPGEVVTGTALEATININRDAAHTLYGRFQCVDQYDRVTDSPWSAAISVPEVILPAPVIASVSWSGAAADGYLNQAEIATGSSNILTVSATGQVSLHYSAAIRSAAAANCDGQISYPATSAPGTAAVSGDDGDYVFCVKAVNSQGTASFKSSSPVRKDTIMPQFGSLALAGDASDGYISAPEGSGSSPLWVMDANGYTEAAYSEAIAVGGGSLSCGSAVNYSRSTIPSASQLPSTDGTYGLCVRLRDAAGNTYFAPSLTLIRQVNQPVFVSLTLASALGDGYLNSSEASSSSSLVGTLSAQAYTSAQYAAASASQECSTVSTWGADVAANDSNLSVDGAYKICVKLVDSGSNVTYGVSASFERDTQAPTPVLSGFPANPSNIAQLNVMVSGTGVVQYAFALLDGAPDCSGATYPLWEAVANPITAPVGADGSKRLCVQGKDTAGNVTATAAFHVWTKDSVGPIVNSFNLAATVATDTYLNSTETSNTEPLWTLDATGQTSTWFTLPLNATGLNCDASQTYDQSIIPTVNQLTADGNWSICVKLMDDSGNSTFESAQMVVRDTAPPVFTSLARSAVAVTDTYINASETSVTGSMFTLAGAGYDQVFYSAFLADSGLTCDGSQTISSSSQPLVSAIGADGTYAVCVKLIDNAGNYTYGKSESITRDTSLPTVSYTGTMPSAQSNVNPYSFSISGDFVKYQYGVNNSVDCSGVVYSAWISATGGIASFDAPLGADGQKTICTRGMDAAGNEQTDATPASWIFDGTPPVASLTGQPAAYSNQPNLAITVSADGMTYYRHEIQDGNTCTGSYGAWVTAGTPITDSIPTDGPKIICVMAKDGAGNMQGTPTTHTWVQDTVAPQLGNGGLINLVSTMNGASVSMTWTAATDANGIAQYTVYHNSAGSPLTDYPVDFGGATMETILSPGATDYVINSLSSYSSRVFNLVVEDLAGNAVAYSPSTSGYVELSALPNGGMIGFNSRKDFMLSGMCSPMGATVNISGSVSESGTCSASSFSIPVNLETIPDGAVNFSATLTSASDHLVAQSEAVTGNISTVINQGDKLGAPSRMFRAQVDGLYGSDVALSEDGLTMVVGARGDAYDGGGGNYVKGAGAVYVYTRPSTVDSWTLQQKLVATGVNGRMELDQFGYSVGLSGDTLVVGAPYHDFDSGGGSPISDAGAVFVFVRSGGVWTSLSKVVAPAGNYRGSNGLFGQSVAIDGSTVVVGATGYANDAAGGGTPLTNAGGVFVYILSGGVLNQEQLLVPGTNARYSGDWFGTDVDISMDTIVVGARNHGYDDSGANNLLSAGAAFVFTRTAGVWSQQQKLVGQGSNGRVSGDYFGYAVSIDADRIVVGAPSQDYDASGTTMMNNAGAAYVFLRSGSVWSLETKVVGFGSNGRYSNDSFGSSVAILGNLLTAGAPGQGYDHMGAGPALSGAGAVYFFTYNGTWNTNQKVSPPYRNVSDNFGASVALYPNGSVVGARGYAVDGSGGDFISNAGAAFTYQFSDPNWSQISFKFGNLDQTLPIPKAGAGKSIKIAENDLVMAVGAPMDLYDQGGMDPKTDAGAVYVYTRNSVQDPWSFSQKLVVPSSMGRNGGDLFGSTLAMNNGGDMIAVGAPYHQTDGDNNYTYSAAGAVFIFRNTGTWTAVQKVVPGLNYRSPNDLFGSSLAMHGNILVVGAPMESLDANLVTVSSAGAAFVFQDNYSSVDLLAVLTANARIANDYFGKSVAVYQGNILVGAPDQDFDSLESNSQSSAGAAYLFTGSGPTWTQTAKITPVGTNARMSGDQFGASVAIWADTMVIAAPSQDYNEFGEVSAMNAGAVYIYSVSTQTLMGKLVGFGNNGRFGQDLFGSTLAFHRDTLMVGAPYADYDAAGNVSLNGAGSAFIFTRSMGTWSPARRVTGEFWPNGRGMQDQFGMSVAIGSDTMAAGADFHSYDSEGILGSMNTGAVFSFSRAP